LQQLKQATPSSIRKFYKAQGYRGEDKLEQLMVNIKKAQPLTQDGAVLLAGTMKVQALVTHPRKTGAHRALLQLLDSSF